MQRVKRSTAVAVLPSPPAGGTPGYFAQPNPQGGVPATIPGYEWYNNVQEELLAVIEAQGLTASDTDRTQLRQAIGKMIQAGQRSVIISSATFAPAVTGTGKAVYWDSANSRFDLALADGSAKQNCVGFADVPNGNVYAFGDAVLFTGLTPGSRYYLDSTTAGNITATAPANAVYIGVAKAANEVFIDIDAIPGTSQHGQCRLAKSGANLLLSPFNGNKLIINGGVQTIPAAGVTLAATGLAAGTTYYIYAYMNGANMALEASATGHSTDATTGIEIKTGDSTRTLVGMARPIAGPAWQDTDAQRFVISWFNRRAIGSYKAMAATATTTSLTPVVISASDKNEFLTWGDEAVDIRWTGNAYNSSGTIQTIANIGIDGALAVGGGTTGSQGGASTTIAVNWDGYLSEGYHYACFIGWVVTASTGYFEVSSSRTELLHTILRG